MLNKNNFEIARLCSKPDHFTQYALSGIRVTPGGTETTDGHALLKVSGEGGQEKFKPPSFCQRRRHSRLPRLCRSGSEIPSHDQASILRIPGSKAVRISVTNQDADLDVYCARPIEGQFPAIDKVIPDAAEAAVEVLLDLDILIPLVAAGKEIPRQGAKGAAARHIPILQPQR